MSELVEFGTVAHQNIFNGKSDSHKRFCDVASVGEGLWVKNNSLPTRPHGCLSTLLRLEIEILAAPALTHHQYSIFDNFV